MARRSDHNREELKELALCATEKLVAMHGYQSVSARKIAKEIGYTVGTLYLVFKNLDDLIMQVNARSLQKMGDELQPIAESPENAERKLLHLGISYYQFAAKNPHLWSLVFEHRLAGQGEILPALSDNITALFSLVEKLLRDLNSHHNEADIAKASASLWSGVHGVCILAITDKLFVTGDQKPEVIIENLVGHFLKGFLSE